ncbi:MAG TPA: hypothetical protein VGM87_05930 [Roseomonas sp.]|jgi:hypothetical protein
MAPMMGRALWKDDRVMKPVLMALVMASIMGLAGSAMAADIVDEAPATRVQLAGSSDSVLISQLSAPYDAGSGS